MKLHIHINDEEARELVYKGAIEVTDIYGKPVVIHVRGRICNICKASTKDFPMNGPNRENPELTSDRTKCGHYFTDEVCMYCGLSLRDFLRDLKGNWWERLLGHR